MSKIDQAISLHGAKAVYAAASKHMAGDKINGLVSVGLTAKTMGDVFRIQSAAHAQMGEADKAIDAADASAALSRVGRPPLPEGAGKTARVELRVHEDTKAAWQAKAAAAGLTLQAWVEKRCRNKL